MLVSVGYDNFVNSKDIVGIVKPESAPVKKLRRGAETGRMLVNATGGRKARSVIVMASNHIILSALQTTTLKDRINEGERDGYRNRG